MGEPVGFAAQVPRVRVWCRICRPAPTPYPSQVTRGFQPPVPTFDVSGGCVRLAPPVTHFNGKSPSHSPAPAVSHPHAVVLGLSRVRRLEPTVSRRPSRDGPRPRPHPRLRLRLPSRVTPAPAGLAPCLKNARPPSRPPPAPAGLAPCLKNACPPSRPPPAPAGLALCLKNSCPPSPGPPPAPAL